MKSPKIHFHSLGKVALLVMLSFFIFANTAKAQFISTCDLLGADGQILKSASCSEAATAKEAEDKCKAECVPPATFTATCNTAVAGSCANVKATPTSALAAVPGMLINWAAKEAIYAITGLINFVNSILRLFITLAGGLFNATLLVAVAPLSDLKFISLGWKIVRDVCNIFFIFILLTIAIATILRIESYGAKKLLPKLIIAALLINFSLVIAGVVVDASNVLAFAFIQKMYPVSDKIAQVLQITTLDRLEAPPVSGAVGAVLSGGYKAAMSLINVAVIPNPNQVLQNAYQGLAHSDLNEYLLQAFLALIMTVLLLVAFFVLIALSILVILRTASLMLLFVLAPIGFLGPVLPATQKAASEWWHKLFSWSFFLPAASFFVYLALQYGEEIKNLNFRGTGELNSAILFNYIVIIILLCGSVVIAQKMGAVGAGAIVKFGQKQLGRVRGYASKKAASAGLLGAQVATYLPAKTLGRIPVIGQTLFAKPYAAITRQREKEKEEKKKQYMGLTKAGADATYKSLVSPREKQRFRDTINEEGKHAGIFTQAERDADYKRYQGEGKLKPMRHLEATDPSIAALGKVGTAAQQAIDQATEVISEKDITDKMELPKDPAKQQMVFNAMFKSWNARKMEAGAAKLGAQFSAGINDAFQREVAAKVAAGKTRDEAVGEVVDTLGKDNKEGRKYMLSSPMTSGTAAATEMRTNIDTRNTQAEALAVQAYRDREAARGRTTPITPAELDQAKRGARKIEI